MHRKPDAPRKRSVENRIPYNPSSEKQQKIQQGGWECRLCTFLNQAQEQYCEMCLVPKPIPQVSWPAPQNAGRPDNDQPAVLADVPSHNQPAASEHLPRVPSRRRNEVEPSAAAGLPARAAYGSALGMPAQPVSRPKEILPRSFSEGAVAQNRANVQRLNGHGAAKKAQENRTPPKLAGKLRVVWECPACSLENAARTQRCGCCQFDREAAVRLEHVKKLQKREAGSGRPKAQRKIDMDQGAAQPSFANRTVAFSMHNRNKFSAEEALARRAVVRASEERYRWQQRNV